MSGHSKWHRIKHQKAATDSKRSKLFGHLSQDIKTAAQTGTNPAKNPHLREAIERARAANLPQANIDRLLNNSTAATKTMTYEGYGPGGSALLIKTTTDNQNRTVSEIRSLLKKHGGTLSEPGSVQWKFSQQVVIEAESQLSRSANTASAGRNPAVRAEPQLSRSARQAKLEERSLENSASRAETDAAELAAIDAGATEIKRDGNRLIVMAPPHAQRQVEQALAQAGSKPTHSQVKMMVPADQQIKLTRTLADQLANLRAELIKHPDVIAVYTDTKNSNL